MCDFRADVEQNILKSSKNMCGIWDLPVCRPEGCGITRWVDEDLLNDMEHRVRSDPDKMKLRKCLAEHPFGTIKHHMDQGFFLMKGLENVNAEMSLSVLAYNFKRVINILGVLEMMVALI